MKLTGGEWSRGDLLALIGVIAAILAIPGMPKFFHWDSEPHIEPVKPTKEAPWFHQLADQSQKEGHIEDARAEYEAALCIDQQDLDSNAKLKAMPPASSEFVYSLRSVGHTLLEAEQFRCAEQLFRHALDYDTRDPAQTHYLLGVALKEQTDASNEHLKINEALDEFSQTEQLLRSITPEPTCTPNGIYTWVGYFHQQYGWALRSKAFRHNGPDQYAAALDEFKKARPCIMSTDWVPTNVDEVKRGTPQKGH